MTYRFLFQIMLVLFPSWQPLLAGEGIVGFWKSIDDKTENPQSLVAIYENKGSYFGRIIGTYGDDGKLKEWLGAAKERAPGVIGNPTYVGLDFIWDLTKEGNKYVDGRIMDPEEGKIYDAELWTDNGKLKVRGKIWVFGRTQTWLPAADADFPPEIPKPRLNEMIPLIRQVR